MKTVAFDEAGNSGENLLDPEQPVFVLAAVCLEESEADSICSTALGCGQATELKFAALRRRPRGQQTILEIFDARAF